MTRVQRIKKHYAEPRIYHDVELMIKHLRRNKPGRRLTRGAGQ